MLELLVISGKGGTGKTSVTASFAALAGGAVLADADVDAADLHLVTAPEVLKTETFLGGHVARIDPDKCTGCGECLARCQFDAITENFTVKRFGCEGCGVCVHFCPAGAIAFPRREAGRWFESNTRFGPMVHARLGIAEENSGMLVSLVRRRARELARDRRIPLILTDGPPGVGCPVIASITGVSAALIVTEPTLSGKHDMERVARLLAHFKVPGYLCVNKHDINPGECQAIEELARSLGIEALGRIPHDPDVTRAMVQGKTLVEYKKNGAAAAAAGIWEALTGRMAKWKHVAPAPARFLGNV
jgi:MinD superfamily P-loop ATPase